MKLFDENVCWHKANLHTHTTVSDGKKTPEESIEIYRKMGYDILAFTDHHKAPGYQSTDDMLIINGLELDTNPYSDRAECFHFCGLGFPYGYVQQSKYDVPAQTILNEISKNGKFAILNHPAWSMNKPEEILSLEGIDAVEIFNTVSGIPSNPDRADSSVLLDEIYSENKFIPVIASDDTHWYTDEVTYAATMIQTNDFTEDGIYKAIRDGKSYATTGPKLIQVEREGLEITVQCSECVSAAMLTNLPWIKDAAWKGPEDTQTFHFKINNRCTFFRILVIDKNGRRAWTNPIPVDKDTL